MQRGKKRQTWGNWGLGWTLCGGVLIFALAQEAPKSLEEELPRIPAVPLDKVQETFALQHGFQLELAAHEPQVISPVDACFDADGRMYVAEMRDYPFSPEVRPQCPEGRGKKEGGIVRLLEDTDADGKYDHSTVFLDKIEWPTSVCPYKGGVFVVAAPHVYYAKDTNGDGVADVREIVFSGFSRNNVQGLVNNMKWDLDNHIYFAGGMNGGTLSRREQPLGQLPGSQIIRFNPVQETLDFLSGGSQFGYSTDDWGHRFVCNNSNHIMEVIFPHHYLLRNPYLPVPEVTRSIAVEGAAAPVFRKSHPEPWRVVRTRRRAADPVFAKNAPPSELVTTGFFTSATGVTIYRGSAYPPEFQGNVFVGDVGGNLVHRKTLTPAGAGFTAKRADADAEFLTSTDNWFRPANFVNAPDGTLFIMDVYRETIEHPISIPADIKAHLNLESGDDRGRIYRLVAPDMKRIIPPKLGSKPLLELVPELASPNSWNRETAQRLLWEAQDQTVVPAVRELALKSENPLGRLHALYTLSGLHALQPNDLISAFQDAHAGVREHALKLSDSLVNTSPELAEKAISLADDPAFSVRWQLALTCGEIQSPAGVLGLARLAHRDLDQSDFRTAWLSSIAPHCGALFAELASDAEFRKQPGASQLLIQLAAVTGAHKDAQHAQSVLQAITHVAETDRPATAIWLTALGQALAERGGSLGQLLAAPETPAETVQQMQRLFASAATTAADEALPDPERLTAVALLAVAAVDQAQPVLTELLTPRTSPALQAAAAQALARLNPPELTTILLENWRGYSPTLRRTVIDLLVRSTARLQSLLAAIAAGTIKSAELERDQKQLLLMHPQTEIRDLAKKLLGSDVVTNRTKVLEQFQTTLTLTGDKERGLMIFQKNCATCHQVGQLGKAVGPNLATVSNKSAADLLISILDPNREALPTYNSYTIVTEQGQILNGLIAAESATSVTLRRADGAQDVVLRANIDQFVSNGISLMPEGLEKDITPQQLADVIEFVRSIPPEKK